jgi:methionyl-tRNA formyltransferase
MITEVLLLASPHQRNDATERTLRARLPGYRVMRVRSAEELLAFDFEAIRPKYVFFPHWSWRIPPDIYERNECVIFHMTDLPFGRGGSPLQNLIVRKIYDTRICAIKCVQEMDAGPVYLKRSLSLWGTAEEIFLRAAVTIADMIVEIVETAPEPIAQRGDATVFKRRTAAESSVENAATLEEVFDKIRMLDADGYPHAFLETETLRLEFSRASLRDGKVIADVEIALRSPRNEG